MRKRTMVIMSVLLLTVCSGVFLLPRFYAAFNQVDDLTVQTSQETVQQGGNLTVTVQDQLETDTKVTLPLPEGLTYQNTYSGNASVTYDAANQQIVIDWLEGQEKQVQITLLAETSGTYSLQASTIREDNHVESAPASVTVEVASEPTTEDSATSDSSVTDGSAVSDEEQAAEQTEPEASTDESTPSTKESSLQTDNDQLQETSKTFNDWFPDDNLAKAVADEMKKQPTDTVTETQLATISALGCSNMSISSMNGLEYLTGLRFLSCSQNNLSELNVSQNTNLIRLNCGFNNLSELNVSQNPYLEDLSCYGNNLGELDISQNLNLVELECNNNSLSSLDVSKNINLTTLTCYYNNLSSLDLSQNPSLTNLSCEFNHLLDFSSAPDILYNFYGLGQTRTLPEQVLTTNTLTIPVDESIKDEKGNTMNILPSNGGIYDVETNTITWTGLDSTGTVSYSFTSTSGHCGGVVTVPYEATVNLACDDEITYVQGTAKTADDFLTDIHATTNEGWTLASDFATVVNMSQPGDYSVTVTAKDQNLENETSKTVTVHVIPYTLQFNTAPTDITFQISAVEEGPKVIPREEADLYSFGVEDTRAADAHWSVTARIDEPLKNTDGDTLDNALVYKKDGQETILTPGNAVEIANADDLTKDDAQF
ncbi:leucine-rich repeat domain-containing protein, partial [Listeria costaricensis]|uniref:leucine-rich repeat domain-containing protein n=1 Tax=Listeria costaricensis TaxID=2026604 RepID=UPI0013C4367E